MGPPVFQTSPRWLLRAITWLSIRIAGPSKAGGEQSFDDLASTLPRDGGLVREMAETVENYRGLSKPVLRLGGSASPNYLKTALSSLGEVLPDGRRVELQEWVTKEPETRTAAVSRKRWRWRSSGSSPR